jgi:phosphoglycolate phosphatase
MKYRLAAFDFDGTLADSGAWFLCVINELADQFGFRRVEPHDQDLLRGYSAGEVIKHLGVPIWKLPTLLHQTRKCAARDASQINLFSGVEQMLHHLRSSGIQIAVVSSNATETIKSILGPASAAAVHHYGCGASLFGKASKLRTALRKAKVPSNASIYIGDEIRDAVAAREVGMAFGAVTWGYTKIEALDREQPDLLFTTVSEIAEALLAE